MSLGEAEVIAGIVGPCKRVAAILLVVKEVDNRLSGVWGIMCSKISYVDGKKITYRPAQVQQSGERL